MALLVGVPAAFAGAAMAQDRVPDASDPKIIQLDAAGQTPDGDVTVFRGSAVDPDFQPRTAPSKVVPGGDSGGGIELVGGDTLWLVDRKASVLTGCYLAATIVAGDLRDIRCESARLR